MAGFWPPSLCGVGRIYRPDVGLLRRLHLRREGQGRRKGVSLQLSLLEFPDGNQAALRGNHRMAMPYRTLAKMSEARRAEIGADAARFLASLA